MVHHLENVNKAGWVWSGVCALALATCLCAGARAQQEQPTQQGQQQEPPQQREQGMPAQGSQPGQEGQPPDAGAQGAPGAQQQPPDSGQSAQPGPPVEAGKPTYVPQDADKPPYASDRPTRARSGQARSDAEGADGAQGENPPPPSGTDGSARQGEQAAPRNRTAARQYQPVPATLTIPAGTVISVRINEPLSSDHNQVGDRFTGVLQQPIVVNGWVVARRGQTLQGQVQVAQKAGRVKGVSQLGLELTDLTVVDGQQVPILTELWKGSAGTSHGQDAATIGTTTALGAAIGAAADWGRGAAIGAGAGAAAGIGAVLLTRGHPTVLEPETQLSFRLVDPVKVDTTQSAQAFLPVSQQDYEARRDGSGPRRVAGGYPPPPPYYGCGYYPCYWYPGYVGFYDGFWWGPSFYYGGYGHRGFRRW